MAMYEGCAIILHLLSAYAATNQEDLKKQCLSLRRAEICGMCIPWSGCSRAQYYNTNNHFLPTRTLNPLNNLQS